MCFAVRLCFGNAYVELRCLAACTQDSSAVTQTGVLSNTVAADGILNIRPANVLRRLQDNVLARVDLNEGEHIITSQINGVTNGMKVRIGDVQKEAGS